MSARLSPAANLLRNSKLFALPPAIALPPTEVSADALQRSLTATTVYPTKAAIETPAESLNRGDWGVKRALPLKSTTKSGTPTIRLLQGIDTRERIADFESAADHVLTLKKFQELNKALSHPSYGSYVDDRDFNVFRPTHDNTTNLSNSSPAVAPSAGIWPSLPKDAVDNSIPDSLRQKQNEIDARRKVEHGSVHDPSSSAAVPNTSGSIEEQRRWRYAGPSLLLMSEMEFDEFLKSLGSDKRSAFRERLKQEIVRGRISKARGEGNMGSDTAASSSPSDEEVSTYLRYLRSNPNKFGPLLAEFLDLPEGPTGDQVMMVRGADVWDYGRSTLATEIYRVNGPPRMHPSAGLSYLRTGRSSMNHPTYGPQLNDPVVVARAVTTKSNRSGTSHEDKYGVAGFIVSNTNRASIRGARVEPFKPQSGGKKVAVETKKVYVNDRGSVQLEVSHALRTAVVDEVAIPEEVLTREQREKAQATTPLLANARNQSSQLPGRLQYKKAEKLPTSLEEEKAFQDIFSEMSSTLSRKKRIPATS